MHTAKPMSATFSNCTGIYCIRNLFDGKEYIGSSALNLRKRWNYHLSRLRRGVHSNYLLQMAFRACGETAFEFDVLEECPPEKCIEREQWWIDAIRPVYNICRTAMGSPMSGRRATPETCAKMSKALMGHFVSPETRAKIGAANKGKKYHLGCRNTPEARARMSAAHNRPEAIAKLRARMMGNKYTLGYKPTPETLAKKSAIMMGNHYSLGKKRSPETRAKMRLANRGNRNSLGCKRSPETISKCRAARKQWWARKRESEIL
jgi:group I intron endonuclease